MKKIYALALCLMPFVTHAQLPDTVYLAKHTRFEVHSVENDTTLVMLPDVGSGIDMLYIPNKDLKKITRKLKHSCVTVCLEHGVVTAYKRGEY